jgi:predicted nucleic acid-binding Zn ribbon protein
MGIMDTTIKENKKCLICNTPMENSHGLKKYCSKECTNKANNQRKRKGTKRTPDELWNGDKKICLDCGIPKEISKYQKRGKNEKGEQIYNARCKECIKPRQTTEYRHKNKGTIYFTCKQCGTPSTHYDRRYTTFCSRECSFAYKQGKEKYIKKMCKRCNGELGENYKRTYCKPCSVILEQEREETAKALQEQKEKGKLNRAIRTLAKRKDQLIERLAKEKAREKALNKHCGMCKEPFRAKSIQAKLCPKCKFTKDMIREITRGKRSKSILPFNFERFDEDITLKKLFKRDKGICHICNITCNYDDYRRNKNNAFIVGGTYPSQDHVIALANGGTHTWDNVKLACHDCNSKKSAKEFNDQQEQLEFFL